MIISFNCVEEGKPGGKWKALFEKTWPFYKKWFLSEGTKARKGYLTSMDELEHFMPQLAPIYHELCELAGGGDLESRFLSMYCPPPYLSGCSQVAWTKDATSLIRNYDYHTRMFEGVMSYTNWLQPVIGVSDCTWGLLDGINYQGLAASLTFGGRKVLGKGFGIPLIIRYILETCNSVPEAVEKLQKIPVHMTYNVTLLDSNKSYCTIYLSPDRPPIVVDTPIATNHQVDIEWADYAVLSRTLERRQFLEGCLHSPHENEHSMIKKFLHAPLYNSLYDKSFGTIYTIKYALEHLSATVFWPEKSIHQSFSDYHEKKVVIHLDAGVRGKSIV